MKLESKDSGSVQESTQIEPIDDIQGSTLGDDTPLKQEYNIATGKVRRQIRPPKWYAYEDMVAYALSVAESIEIPEPSTYNKASRSDETADNLADMMTKPVYSRKFEYCLELLGIQSGESWARRG